MKVRKIQICITLSALALATIHIWWSTLAIDAVTVTLVLAAMIPWLAPLFRKLKLPGGWEFEFEVDRQVSEITAAATALPKAPPTPAQEGDRERLLRLAAISPEAAVVEAWRVVENRLVSSRSGYPQQLTSLVLGSPIARYLATVLQGCTGAHIMGCDRFKRKLTKNP